MTSVEPDSTQLCFDCAALSLFRLGLDGKVLDVNKQACRELGYSDRELGDMHVFAVDPNMDPERWKQLWDTLCEQKVVKFESVNRTKDGATFSVEVIARSVQCGDDNSIVAVVRNISDEKRASQLLRLSRFCIEKASIPIFRIEADERIVEVNEAACKHLGYSREELLELTIPDINPTITPERGKSLWRHLQTYGSQTFETTHHHKDGTIIPVEVTANLLEFEGRVFSVAFVQDIARHKEFESSLRTSKFCIDRASVAILWSSVDGDIFYGNETTCRSLGYSREELCTLHILDIDPVFSRESLEVHRKELRAQGVKRFESIHRRKDGSTFPVEIIANYFEVDGNAFSISCAMDITERKKAEQEREVLQQQLIQAQKMEAVGQLAGGIAHDFNNLLQSILISSQMLLWNAAEHSPAYGHLKQIEASSLKASDLTRRLLTYSRKIESNLQPTNLNEQVEQVVAILKRTLPKMISIDLFLEENLCTIPADPLQIEQILMNLAINAQHAMPEGGTLTIETRTAALDKQFCRTHLGAKAGDYLILSIADNGTGMDQETMDQVYDPFFTTKRVGEGSGLGLSMVYGIVKNHNAYITCYSEPGQGTIFKIYFPVMDGGCRDTAVAEEAFDEPTGGAETILLVDDDQDVLRLTESMLNRYGYKTITAHSGEEALELYGVERERIDLVLLDLNMPGMGGSKCLEALVDLDSEVKVLVTSGFSPNRAVRTMLEAGAGNFIGKPFQIGEVLSKIKEALDTD